MIDFFVNLDVRILLFLNGLNHELLDPYMKAFSGQWIWLGMYAALAAVLVWKFGWKKAIILMAAIGIAVALSDSFSARIVRPFFQRLRPANLDNPISSLVHIVGDYRGGRYGFPSCHAANSFALAVSSALMLRSKKYTAFIFVWAVLQCYSRIYLGVHFMGDLIVGALIGSTFGYLGYLCTRPQCRQFNPKSSTWPVLIVGIATMILIELIILF
ncbi:MAG: phosphatase PAP2 family protein [Bacteroidales bacterium]|nr:phosphatase PAP2 family protein [Bacteroidales bacterium]